ncbi:MAG: family ATPase [Sphingobacterium sp.]|jgi:predicted ATPase|uniref:AAA family ATPase n=1 Tax=Sphingobacterium sp. NGMCC 1.201703 TaxID=3388657 RepID=UPI002A5E5455|nr:family ATPase [Sphingobacterium sp.]
MYYIHSIKNTKPIGDRIAYPFNIASILNLSELRFRSPVTFIIGENGSGKSTLVEAIAINAGFNPEGGTKNFNFHTKDSHSELFKDLQIIRTAFRENDGFFLRAESFYNVATEVDDIFEGDQGALQKSYGGSLHECSHGESFLNLMHRRFSGRGLYLLDEPESALSINSQLRLLTRMNQLVNNKSQFIIATHSPILLAYPDAEIYTVSELGLQQVDYEETEQFKLYRYFLNNYQKMVAELGLHE